MPYYLILTTLTPYGRNTVRDQPERIKEVDEEVAAMGVNILAQYALLGGPYDFANLVEAPDNHTIMRMAVALGGRGTLTTLSMPAIPIDEFIASLRGIGRDTRLGGLRP